MRAPYRKQEEARSLSPWIAASISLGIRRRFRRFNIYRESLSHCGTPAEDLCLHRCYVVAKHTKRAMYSPNNVLCNWRRSLELQNASIHSLKNGKTDGFLGKIVKPIPYRLFWVFTLCHKTVNHNLFIDEFLAPEMCFDFESNEMYLPSSYQQVAVDCCLREVFTKPVAYLLFASTFSA